MKNMKIARSLLSVAIATCLALPSEALSDLSQSKPRLAIVQVLMNFRVKKLALISNDSVKDRDLQKLLIPVRLRQADECAKSSFIENIERETNFSVLKDSATENLL